MTSTRIVPPISERLAGVALVLGMAIVACDKSRRPGASAAVAPPASGSTSDQRSVAPTSNRVRAEDGALPANGIGIVIVPTVEGPKKDLALSFCYYDDSQYDPLIWQITIGNADGIRCHIMARGDAWLWKKWNAGTVPKGFRGKGCPSLPAGEYEVLVDAVVGTGSVRMSVDSSGEVRRLPWDNLSGVPRETCVDAGRTTPRIIGCADPSCDAVPGNTKKKRPR